MCVRACVCVCTCESVSARATCNYYGGAQWKMEPGPSPFLMSYCVPSAGLDSFSSQGRQLAALPVACHLLDSAPWRRRPSVRYVAIQCHKATEADARNIPKNSMSSPLLGPSTGPRLVVVSCPIPPPRLCSRPRFHPPPALLRTCCVVLPSLSLSGDTAAGQPLLPYHKHSLPRPRPYSTACYAPFATTVLPGRLHPAPSLDNSVVVVVCTASSSRACHGGQPGMRYPPVTAKKAKHCE
jgi:hypothetical protein